MAHPEVFLFLSCLLVQAAHAGLVNFENDLGELVYPKQPLLASREGRFIRFDTKDSEIELELGVAVPFLKIPTLLGSPTTDHLVTINLAGLLVGGAILLTSFLLVPLLLPSQTSGHGNGYGYKRSDEKTVPAGAWSIIKEADELLKNYNLDVRECSKKAVCETAESFSHFGAGVGDKMLQSAISLNVIQEVLDNANLTSAVHAGLKGHCFSMFPSCVLSTSLLPHLFS